jgi:hypothetical protein
MIYSIAVFLVILWLVGFATAHLMGGFIHLLLVIALVVVVAGVFNGRRAR